MSPEQTEGPECTCFWTDPSTWTMYYGAAEPSSTREWNPDCPAHKDAFGRGVSDVS